MRHSRVAASTLDWTADHPSADRTLHSDAIVAILGTVYVHASAGPLFRSRRAAGDWKGTRGTTVEIRPSFAVLTAPNRASTERLAHEPASVDPARDGLVGLYALRILDRGIDPRTLVAEHRSIRYGLHERTFWRLAADTDSPPIVAVGRGAVTLGEVETPRLATAPAMAAPSRPLAPVRVRRLSLPSTAGLASLMRGPIAPARTPRRLVAAGLAVAAMLGVGLLGALAQEQPSSPPSAVEAGASLPTHR